METFQCSQCGKEIEGGQERCPHCGAVAAPIPNYPRFKGGGVFMVMWIFFVILVAILLVTLVVI